MVLMTLTILCILTMIEPVFIAVGFTSTKKLAAKFSTVNSKVNMESTYGRR